MGDLYIVATPLGNRLDITLRAIEVLKSVNRIAVEDKRHSLPLLNSIGINKPLFSLHEHNEREQVETLLGFLKTGESVALISDAGTPLISDPGFHLVASARKQGIRVIPVPGPCAVIAALSVAGLPTDKFIFEGFLSSKSSARIERLKTLFKETRTLVFYEAPHRIKDFLFDLQEVMGQDRKIVIARELTKVFETIHSGTISETIYWMEKDTNQTRGEFVVVVSGYEEKTEQEDFSEINKLLTLLLDDLSVKKASEITAKFLGERKNKVYEYALQLKK